MLSTGNMQEVIFAQRLADNEKKVRDRALKKLKVFISLKTSHGSGLTEEEALKIWKGLFYCMYMADKPLVQEDVAEDISYLIHDVVNPKDRYTFVTAAFRTFAREWNGIDTFRIDKFMMFMRRVLRQVFVHLKLRQWRLKEIVRYMNILDINIVRAEDHTNVTPLGIKLHLCSIIMEELAKIAGEDANTKVILAVIKPFLKVLAISKSEVYRNAVAEEIIRHLMRQTEVGVEGEETIQAMVNGELNMNTKWPKENNTKIGNDDIIDDEDLAADDDDMEMEERTLEEAVLDPRAGSVDVFLPQLKPDFDLLANALQDVGSLNHVSKVNRLMIYTLVKECRDMAGNLYPLAISQNEENEDEEEEEEEEEEKEGKAVERLQEFYDKLKEGTSVDASKMEDLKTDPLKNLSLEKRQFEKNPRRKKMKIKRLEKKTRSLKKKKALAKQQVAAEVNRLKAVEAKLGQINEVVGVPNITNMPLKRKDSEISTASVKPLEKKRKSPESSISKMSKRKKIKSKKFDVSALKPDNVEVQTKVPSSLGFEVTPIPNKDANKSEPNNGLVKIDNLCASKLSTNPEDGVNDMPEKVKEKKKKNKKKADKDTGHKSAVGDLPKKAKVIASKETDKPISVGIEDGHKAIVGNVPVACTDAPGKRIKSKGKTSETVLLEGNSHQNSEEADSVDFSKKKAKLKKKSGNVNTEGKDKLSEVNVTLKTSKKKIKSNKKDTVNAGAKQGNTKRGDEPSAEVCKTKDSNKSTESKVPSLASALDNTVPGNSSKKTPTKGKGLTMNFSGEKNGSAWSKPLEEDIEIFLKKRRNMKLERRRSIASVNSPKGTPKTPKTKERTIKINLKQNQEHDFKDYVHSVRNSPQIPYSADKLPKAPVLKPSLSPILVGRPALKILKNVMRKSPSTKSASPLLKKSPKPKKMHRNKAADFF